MTRMDENGSIVSDIHERRDIAAYILMSITKIVNNNNPLFEINCQISL